jgi:hypothetical protein
LFAGFWL